LVDIVVTDENLHAAFLFDRAIDGPNGQGARATGARICTLRVPTAPTGTNQRRYLKLCQPMGTMPANWKKRKLRYVAVFWAALRANQMLARTLQ
jgi:hypothetical protein